MVRKLRYANPTLAINIVTTTLGVIVSARIISSGPMMFLITKVRDDSWGVLSRGCSLSSSKDFTCTSKFSSFAGKVGQAVSSTCQ